ncbi:MAG TPA: hypothetical protein VHM93_10930 [Candidatus Acidoferrum sp.]|nr:hypothetical protein [Candidatus Acidoferrum sp.]
MFLQSASATLRDSKTRHSVFGVLIWLASFPLIASSGQRSATTIQVENLTRYIPIRSEQDLTGSEFARYVSKMSPQEREQAILEEISKGNLPEFLRKLVPVKLQCELANGKSLIATIFVTPDYLAIGSDSDFLRIPMNLHTAVEIAERFGFVLPTKKMVDAIYLQSSYRLAPQPLPASPEMRSTAYYSTHNLMIEDQLHAIGARLGALISGDKKDVVMSNRLQMHAGRIAIYGWHRGPGEPIQPLSTVHGANYADYSHGIRLISEWALINGKIQSIRDLLRYPSTAKLFSDEGPIYLRLQTSGEKQDSSEVAPLGSN